MQLQYVYNYPGPSEFGQEHGKTTPQASVCTVKLTRESGCLGYHVLNTARVVLSVHEQNYDGQNYRQPLQYSVFYHIL